ncbi:hypothetical protein A3E97_03585 [Candidatus Uhrbacteria bacterium RIFCSPHIGHO2_12_FULL_47_12]|nr:MAG: hypothetical protein A2839_04555 [Candidatus Uhrbacteria bacterium RIFCSPHIGHO2_01_FULL_47_10]OGL77517.1 MAG: hypothetical protein A3E97_03585 [Candidatus Uhrbacteria bacterium RIFCSPHIGHO2_12_FULL_47_12]
MLPLKFKAIKTVVAPLIAGLVLLYLISAGHSALQGISESNLKSFRELTAADPLFYDPATDVKFLRESVREMQHADDLILYVDSLYRSSGPPKYRDVFPEGWRLWPDEFLAVLPAIHETTNDFLAAPSPEKASALLDLYIQATKHYKTAIMLHFEAMEKIFATDPAKKYITIAFFGSGTTPEIVRNDFLLIQKNAYALEEEVELRKKCLYRGQCSLPVAPRQQEAAAVQIPFQPLPSEILGIDPAGTDVIGPYWERTRCFGASEDKLPLSLPFYLKIDRSAATRHARIVPVLANTKYYIDYTQFKNKAGAPALNLAAGIQIKPHGATYDYTCTDLTYLPRLIKKYLATLNVADELRPTGGILATLPYLIQGTVKVKDRLIYDPLITKQAWHPLNFIITRSGYSIYFGTFTSRVWRLNEQPQFLLSQKVKFRHGFVTYDDLLERGWSRQEIINLNSLPPTEELLPWRDN